MLKAYFENVNLPFCREKFILAIIGDVIQLKDANPLHNCFEIVGLYWICLLFRFFVGEGEGAGLGLCQNNS